MNKLILILIGLFFSSSIVYANDTLKVSAIIYKGDTFPAKYLNTVFITDFRPFKDYEQQR
ncbi:MAG: hypothetical protein RL065_1702, partial [Bacteroidota bacterium]